MPRPKAVYLLKMLHSGTTIHETYEVPLEYDAPTKNYKLIRVQLSDTFVCISPK